MREALIFNEAEAVRVIMDCDDRIRQPEAERDVPNMSSNATAPTSRA